ncbi:MAG: HAD-IA family hydrolase [Capnocytophaga sp.]|nr:HAD-IA family hydrolase [Capnocytophaga sp.]
MKKLNIQNYTHFSFDLWLTLLQSHKEYKPKRDQLFKTFFDLKNAQEEVSQAIRYYDVASTKISEITGKHIERSEIYLLILSHLGVDISTININILEDFFSLTERLFLEYPPKLMYPNILELFNKIQSEGKTINILSNTAFILGKSLHKVLNNYHLTPYLSFEIYSDEVGIAKPNPDIFEILYQKANEIRPISKKQIIHIGDNQNADYNGAKKTGLQAFWIEK